MVFAPGREFTLSSLKRLLPEVYYPNVSEWLHHNAVERICVVSPHLDDAVFSTCGLLLSDARSQCYVTTVFTEADPAFNSWAHRAGFRDSYHEYQVRRNEDQIAMEQLNVEWNHVGATPARWSTALALNVAQQLIDKAPSGPLLVLLPAGAGGPRPGPVGTWLRRCLRKPFGALPHAEHCAVRDELLNSLQQIATHIRVFVGFYAEFPYIWSDSGPKLRNKLSSLYSPELSTFYLRPNPANKLAVASQYASQVEPILGASVKYRQRALGHDELYLLPNTPLK
jgi:hypothetical protein